MLSPPSPFCAPAPAFAGDVGSGFTYQGRLLQSGSPVNGFVNLQCRLLNAASGGAQVGSTVTLNGTPVNAGLFTVALDFGVAAFDGAPRWLEIGVNGVTLVPRQKINPAPYAIQTRGIYVDPVGNVGIGTTVPTEPLDVEGSVQAFDFQLGNPNWLVHREFNSLLIPGWNPNAAQSGIFLESSGGIANPGGMYIDADVTSIWNDGADILRLYKSNELPAANPKFVVDGLGRVGIGNADPAWPIDVTAAQAVGRFVTSSNTNGSVIELRSNTPFTPAHLGAINFANSAGGTPG